MKGSVITLFLSMALAFGAAATQAVQISHSGNIAVSGFILVDGADLPLAPDPLLLDYSVSFDNSNDIFPTQNGLVINSINWSFPGPLFYAYSAATDNLHLGRGIGTSYCTLGADSLCLIIEDVSTAPYISASGGVPLVTSSGGVWAGRQVTGPLSTSVVPVPAAAWLFGSALFGLGAIKRKRA